MPDRDPTSTPSTYRRIVPAAKVPTTWCHWLSLIADGDVTSTFEPALTPKFTRPSLPRYRCRSGVGVWKKPGLLSEPMILPPRVDDVRTHASTLNVLGVVAEPVDARPPLKVTARSVSAAIAPATPRLAEPLRLIARDPTRSAKFPPVSFRRQ